MQASKDEVVVTHGKRFFRRLEILHRLPQFDARIHMQLAAEHGRCLARFKIGLPDRAVIALVVIAVAFAMVGDRQCEKPLPRRTVTQHHGRVYTVKTAVGVAMVVR